MKSIVKIFRYIRPYWLNAFLNVFFNLLYAFFSLFSITLVVPLLNMLFQDSAVTTEILTKPEFGFSRDELLNTFTYYASDLMGSKDSSAALIFIVVLTVVLFFFKNLFRYLAMFFIAPVRNGVVKDLRQDVYRRVIILPLSFFSDQKKGDIMARMTNDVQEVEFSIMSCLEMIFREPILILLYAGSLVLISPQLTLMMMILVPVAVFLISFIGRSLRRTSLKVQNKMGTLISVIEETLGGLRIIKAFNAQEKTNKNFDEHNERYFKLANRVLRKKDLSSPLSEFLAMLILAVVIWVGGRLVLDPSQNISADMFILYVVVFSQLIVPVKAITTAYYNVQKGLASISRIEDVLDAEEVIVEKENALSIPDFKNEINFKDVWFKYDKGYVLEDINILVEKGQTVALVGSSGGGKSTLANLLPRFYDVGKGSIFIDGVDIKDGKINDLRDLMGIVTQESILFHDTIFNNISFGVENADMESVIAAAKVANAHNFITQIDEGYNAVIGDQGTKLSGGQRQRLSIARAVLANPPIMILDEATSALDTESEKLVQDALDKLMENRTSVVIAHRLSTIQNADKIYVIEKGKVLESGKHKELLDKKGFYFKLCNLQSFQ